MSVLIKNAQLVSGEIVNIFIKDEFIFSIDKKLPIADHVIDADGKLALPGIIDPHVHFRVPGGEHKEDWTTGSRAAVAGGVTTVLDMPNNSPAITTTRLLEEKRGMIQGRSLVNYGLYMGATESNLEELKSAPNIAGIKVYLGSSTGDLLVEDYGVLENILRETDSLVACHSEDEACLRGVVAEGAVDHTSVVSELHYKMRPEACAKQSAERVVEIIRSTGRPVYFCHVSSARELDIFRHARQDNLPFYIEATPHHLFLSKEDAANLGNYARVNPPLRGKDSIKALQRALIQGEIDTIGTDHAPHTREEKEVSYNKAPSGLPGIQLMLPLMLDYAKQGSITLEDLEQLMCHNPARIFNIQKRGKLNPGYYADITIVDLDLTRKVKNSTLYSKCGWSLFEDQALTGWPMVTCVNGHVAFKNSVFADVPHGREVAL